MTTAEASEFVENLRALLRSNAVRFGPMVERQVKFAFLPKVAGTRSALEPALWSLLVLLLDGHEQPTPAASDATWDQALTAARGGAGLCGPAASFPRAAAAVAEVASDLRRLGVYPPPKLSRSA